jgi:hypothetical protein
MPYYAIDHWTTTASSTGQVSRNPQKTENFKSKVDACQRAQELLKAGATVYLRSSEGGRVLEGAEEIERFCKAR